jgi:hypothetical protein
MVNDESIIRRSPLVIGFASMSNNDNVNELRIIVDGIDHAIVANANPLQEFFASQLAATLSSP